VRPGRDADPSPLTPKTE